MFSISIKIKMGNSNTTNKPTKKVLEYDIFFTNDQANKIFRTQRRFQTSF